MTQPTPPAAPLNARQRRALATIPWRAVVWIIFLAVFWNAAALLIAGNTRAYDGPTYQLLRYMPGGMRVYGVLLGALLVVTVYAYGRNTFRPRDKLLKGCLAGLAAWYVGWTFAICWAWLTTFEAPGVGGLSQTVAFAAACVLAAWFAPGHHTAGKR